MTTKPAPDLGPQPFHHQDRGRLERLGKGRVRVTCGRCKAVAEDFRAPVRPGREAKQRGWALWRYCGWVCPACEADFHGH